MYCDKVPVKEIAERVDLTPGRVYRLIAVYKKRALRYAAQLDYKAKRASRG